MRHSWANSKPPHQRAQPSGVSSFFAPGTPTRSRDCPLWSVLPLATRSLRSWRPLAILANQKKRIRRRHVSGVRRSPPSLPPPYLPRDPAACLSGAPVPAHCPTFVSSVDLRVLCDSKEGPLTKRAESTSDPELQPRSPRQRATPSGAPESQRLRTTDAALSGAPDPSRDDLSDLGGPSRLRDSKNLAHFPVSRHERQAKEEIPTSCPDSEAASRRASEPRGTQRSTG